MLPLHRGSHPSQRLPGLLLKLLVPFLLTLALALGAAGGTLTAWGQLPLPTPAPAAEDGSQPPAEVTRVGSIEIAPVRLAGRELFKVVAPTVFDRRNPGSQLPVEWRASTIEESLLEVLQRRPQLRSAASGQSQIGGWARYRSNYDPSSLRVEVAQLNSQTILVVSDANHPQPKTLLTVTALDARYENASVEMVAERWRETLQTTLVEALQQRQPEAIRQQVQQALAIAIGMAALSLLLWLLLQLLRLRRKELEARHEEEEAAAAVAQVHTQSDRPEEGRSQFLLTLRSQFNLERRLGLVSVLQWLAMWGQVVVWLGGLFWIYSRFPATAPQVEALSKRLLFLLLIWFTIGLLNRLGNLVIVRLARAWEDRQLPLLEDDQRRSLRIPTIVRSLKGFKTFAVYLLGLGWALNILGVSLSSVLTLSAIFALAISFASQSLVKDLVNGFLILVEDQYAIGDFVTLGTASGLVENLNLRITQLRDVEGRLITVPNSQISVVENWTRIWSRVDFTVTVAYSADIKQTLELVEAVAQELYRDPIWGSKILEPPKMLGVERMGHEGVVIRVWIITKPMQQFDLKREMNRRVRLALEEASIEVGRPQQQVMWQQPSSTATVNGGAAPALDNPPPVPPSTFNPAQTSQPLPPS